MNASKGGHSAASKLIFGAVVVGIIGFLIFREPSKMTTKPPGKNGKNSVTARGSSKLWFGIRAKKGPTDVVTGKARGVRVLNVVNGSPADSCGLASGDLILEFAGKGMNSPRDLAKLMDGVGADKGVTVKVRRGDRILFLAVKLESGGSKQILKNTVARALTFLADEQRDDGAFNHFHLRDQASPAVTALVTWALAVSVPEDADAASVEKDGLEAGIRAIKDWIKEDGALDTSNWDIGHRSYGNACAILALSAHDATGNQPEIQQLTRFLLANQVEEKHGYDPVDWRYGGFPYYESMESSQLRTDVSTLAFVVQALSAAKVDPSHPVWRRIGLWLDETQNYALLGETAAIRKKEAPFRDGGFAFSPRNSKAESPPEEVAKLRIFPSYGSATADGLRTLILVDGSATHKRALAALQWLARNYGFEGNPGLPLDGPTPWGQALFHYYNHSLARALCDARVARIIVKVEDAPNKGDEIAHYWPAELIRELARRQLKDGSWKNRSPLMGEDDPIIATAFSLLALHAAGQTLELTDVVSLHKLPAPKAPVWKEEVLEAPHQDPIMRGLQIYKAKQCASCHKDAVKYNGPSLVGVADRFLEKFETPGAARTYMKKHLRNPKQYPGTRPWTGSEMFPYTERLLAGPELEDLVTFLLTRTGDRPVSKAVVPGEISINDPDVGGRLFTKHNCNSCHREPNGHAPSLKNVGVLYITKHGSKTAARSALVNHIRRPEKYKSIQKPRGNGPKMMPYNERILSKEELADIVAYLMRLK
jgi:squalene-hopene/tetraprenyl-beta-curcumene cyclase